MTKEELLKKIDFEKSWLYDCGIFGSDVDIAFHAIKNSVIETLEQEPCEDAVSRQAVQEYIANYLSQYLYNDVREAVEVIDEYIGELPSVNTQKPKTGHWIKYGKLYQCSECKELSCCQGKFCNECGAQMVKPQESEEKDADSN